MTAADRGLLLQLIRGPARVAALDVPGLDPLALALSGKSFVPSAEAEAFLSNQIDAVRAQRASRPEDPHARQRVRGRDQRLLRVEGDSGGPVHRERRRRVRRAHRGALRHERWPGGAERDVPGRARDRLGDADARRVFADLRESNDPESPVSVPGSFPQQSPIRCGAGKRRRSTTAASPARRSRRRRSPRTRCSSGRSGRRPGTRSSSPARRSATSSPSSSRRWSSTGAGFDVRGAVFPGVPLVLVGRGPDFAWSATSSQADNLDLFVETLCDDDTHYLYRGQCEPMRRFFAGTLKAQGQPDQEISYDETTHGPVIGYATVGGKRVAISVQRSTRGRELLSTKAFYDLNTGAGRLREGLPLDDERRRVQLQLVLRGRSRHRALLERAAPDSRRRHGSGAADGRQRGLRLARVRPVRGPRAGDQPAVGRRSSTGTTGLRRTSARPTRTSRTGRCIASISCAAAVAARKKHSLATLTGAMNKAATQDLRAVRVWPIIRAVLQTGPAPSARAEAAAGLLDSWRANGSSRLDRELDGKVDDPGAAVMDAAWPRLADAVMTPGARPARRPARGAARAQRRRESRRLGVHLRLVRVRRQGSADAPRARGARAVLAPLLRRGRARDVPRGALGRDRRGGRGARGDAGAGALVVARGCDRRADPVHVRRAPRHDALDEPADLPAAHVVLDLIGRGSYARRVRKRYLMAPGPTPVPPGGARRGRGAGHPPPRAGLPRAHAPDARPAAAGLPDARTTCCSSRRPGRARSSRRS